jgi:hypothetical protein
VQTFTRNRRLAHGDNDDLDELNKHVETLKYNSDPNKMFVFGYDGDGTEEHHFHLGFTSITILKKMEHFNNRGCFHIDATYKIVK